MNRTAMSVAIIALSSTATLADASLAITLDLDDPIITTITYQCSSNKSVQVQYINSEHNNLALVPVEGNDRVFVNVVAASGSRYLAGQYEWWSKGENAMLNDFLKNKKILDCKAASQ